MAAPLSVVLRRLESVWGKKSIRVLEEEGGILMAERLKRENLWRENKMEEEREKIGGL